MLSVIGDIFHRLVYITVLTILYLYLFIVCSCSKLYACSCAATLRAVEKLESHSLYVQTCLANNADSDSDSA